MLIRQASTSDLPSILQLYAEVLDKGQVLSLSEAEVLFQKMSSYPNYKVYVAEQERQVIGTFALLIMDNLAHRGTPSGIVEDVAVQENLQGKGIGRQMMKYAMQVCSEAGCYKLVLSSNQKRVEAHAFYESLGFDKHGFSFLVPTLL
ncbi:GNAT family N-acetyltransferase [Flectobacillus sp. BAB-3569]|uniref:GNAT family N-acetyltransferase n=1 Tax=Flectobacillus sp. BAB-3569 TaxID=1509483 RepID=UPI000BA464A1|nr:GNAT family N-acetyltransferase [Flectobacillus sp. BAB-3569]PAC32934.1 GNAT family N-acetyltransferase [Flectobacillus sp. BAB-3569]